MTPLLFGLHRLLGIHESKPPAHGGMQVVRCHDSAKVGHRTSTCHLTHT